MRRTRKWSRSRSSATSRSGPRCRSSPRTCRSSAPSPVTATDLIVVQVVPPSHDSWAHRLVVPPLLFMPEVGPDADAVDGRDRAGQAGGEAPEAMAVLVRMLGMAPVPHDAASRRCRCSGRSAIAAVVGAGAARVRLVAVVVAGAPSCRPRSSTQARVGRRRRRRRRSPTPGCCRRWSTTPYVGAEDVVPGPGRRARRSSSAAVPRRDRRDERVRAAAGRRTLDACSPWRTCRRSASRSGSPRSRRRSPPARSAARACRR